MNSSAWHILLYLFLVFQVGYTQDYVTTQYFKEDGLPSDYCYNVLQDEAGFLWVPNEAGLVIFDGQNFQTDIFSELEKKEIIEVFKDSWGRIWMVELSGEIFYIDEGKLKHLDYPYIGDNRHFVHISDDQNGHIWINYANQPIAFGFDAETLELKYNFNTLEQQLDLLQSPGYVLHAKNAELIGKDIHITCNGISMLFRNFNINKFYSKRIIYPNDIQILNYKDRLYEYDFQTGNIRPLLQQFQSYFNKGIHNITKDKNGNLWIATRSGFYRISSPLSDESKIEVYFENSNSSFVAVDNLNNVWLSTTDQGLKKLTETSISKLYDPTSQNITEIIHQYGHLVYGTSKGEVSILNKNYKEIFRHQMEKKPAQIYDLKPLEESKILITTSREINILDLADMTFTNLRAGGFYKSASVALKKDEIWVNGGQSNVYISIIEKNKFHSISPELRSYCSLPISATTAYIGSVDGLFKANVNGSAQQILPSTIQVDVRSICKASDGSLWIGTHGNGVYILQQDTLVHHLNNLPSKYVRDIIQDKDKMWIATNNGLCLATKVKQTFNIKVLDKADGLSSEQVNALYLHDDNLFVATKKGISIVNRNIKFDKEVPIVKFNSIKINERDTSILNSYQLKSDQRNIKFDFGGILFSKPNSIQFKYMLNGLESEWVYSENATAQYPSLPPGNYSFLLKAKSLNSRWSDLKQVDFVIPKKLSERLIFKILLGALAFLFIFIGLLFFSRSRSRARNYKVSQMTALRAQMNPHFIFNSLNSVQDYILRDDKIAANRYISRFSKLMRYILNASEREFTNLKKELEFLEAYMSIESMRFDNELNYNIVISKNLEPEKYMIPTMILQPYIENAINHGLKHASGEKNLYLRVKKYNSGLLIEIEDNGVGRIKSRKIKLSSDSNYDSKGTQINQQRIELLNKHFQNENKVTFKDIYDEERKPIGTKVEIFLQSIKLA